MNAPESRVLTSEPGNGLLPIGEFYTPEYYALEKERIFKKSWLRVGTEKRISNVGDYFVQELEVCDTSVIVVRGRDKRIRAFHNHCSHRGNRVAYEVAGNTNTFKCRFHSWAFGLDGRLLALPEESGFPGLVKADNGLTEVACDIWEGFIFINVDPQPEQTLREYLGEEIYTGYSNFFQKFERVGKFTTVMHANWKICLDAFIETYHFSTVHAATAGDVILSREFPNGRVDAFRQFSKHRTASCTSNIEHTPTFAESLARKYAGNATLAPDPTKEMIRPPQINPKNLPDWATDILIIFPMANIQPLQGFVGAQNYWPLAHDRTRWELEIYMLPPQSAAGEVAVEYNRAHLRDLIREDLQNLAWVQGNLKAGSKQHHVLGEMEVLIRAGYKTVAEQVGHGW